MSSVLEQACDRDPEASTAVAEASPAPRVLFIDDDRAVLDGLRRALHAQRAVWAMHFFDSAARALAELDADTVDRATVIVSDWLMPGLDGLALCRKLSVRAVAAAGGGHRAYVILLTGNDGVDNLVTALEAGADEFMVKPFDPRELLARIRVGVRVASLEHSLRQANQQLVAAATTDALTGLLNRRRAQEMLDHELARCERGMQALGIALVDVDHFKRINDELGHQAGDAVLSEIARRLRAACRIPDAVARWGGEEFLVLCPAATRDGILAVAERLRQAVAAPPVNLGAGSPRAVTISIGVSVNHPGCRTSASALLAVADRALYQAKSGGRNRVQWGET